LAASVCDSPINNGAVPASGVPSVYCIRGDFWDDDGHFLERSAAIEEWYQRRGWYFCDAPRESFQA